MYMLNAYDAGASPLKAHKGSAGTEIQSHKEKLKAGTAWPNINMPDSRG